MTRLKPEERFALLYVVVFLAGLMLAGYALGAGCLADGGLLSQSTNCLGMPTIPKFFDPTIVYWHGAPFLFVNDGNELVTWRLTNQLHPTPASGSNFNIKNQGDSDYDLMNYSLCDGCRYGVAAFKTGMLLWDAGTGNSPTFAAREFYQGAAASQAGAFTFMSGSQEYLLANGLPGDIGPDGTLYRFNGPADIEPVAGVDADCGIGDVVNGVRLGDKLLIGYADNWLHLFRVTDGGAAYMGKTQIRAFMGRGKTFSVRGNVGVSAFGNEAAKLWNLQDPANPVQIGSVSGAYFNSAAISGDFLFMNKGMNANAGRTYYLGGPGIVPMDQEFWSPDNPWNNHAECEWQTGAVFSPDGTALYLARYAVLQVIDFSACPPPEPPLFADGFESGDASAWSATAP